MEEIISFIINNWLPILIMITCMIHDPVCALVVGFGFMIFGMDNQIFLWIAFVVSILNIGTQTYAKAGKVTKNIKKEESKIDHKWEM